MPHGAPYVLKGQMMKTYEDEDGYLHSTAGFPVHRAVALAFVPNPDNKPMVNHKDGNKQNNHAINLEWCTSQENAAHAKTNGLMARGTKVNTNILTEQDVITILCRIKRGDNRKQIADDFGVCLDTIFKIKAAKNWAWIVVPWIRANGEIVNKTWKRKRKVTNG